MLIFVKMRCLIAAAVVLSLLSGWSCAQAPGDAESFCTETLPSVGVNILDYPPEVKPLMDYAIIGNCYLQTRVQSGKKWTMITIILAAL